MGEHDGRRAALRRRFHENGPDALLDRELLELYLSFAAPRGDTGATAKALLARYGTLAAVLAAPERDLTNVPGVGEHTALLIHLLPVIWRRAALSEQETVMASTSAAGRYLLEQYRGETRERVRLLCLDRKSKLLSCRTVGEGGFTGAGFSVRTLAEQAILSGASAVILAHNHPSGLALPSDADLETTAKVKTALEAVGIPLLDHIIVADGDYVSLAESGCV